MIGCQIRGIKSNGDVPFQPAVGYLDGFILPVGSDVRVIFVHRWRERGFIAESTLKYSSIRATESPKEIV